MNKEPAECLIPSKKMKVSYVINKQMLEKIPINNINIKSFHLSSLNNKSVENIQNCTPSTSLIHPDAMKLEMPDMPVESVVECETTVRDIPHVDRHNVVFHIIKDGSKRGNRKLISTDGYSYTVKRSRGLLTKWTCRAVNPTTKLCRAWVKQQGSSFIQSTIPHSHPPNPHIQQKALRGDLSRFDEASMQNALEAVRDGKLSIRGASKHFCVPFKSLMERLGLDDPALHSYLSKRGPLSLKQERTLVRWIDEQWKLGVELSEDDVIECARSIVQMNNGTGAKRKDLFASEEEGYAWIKKFIAGYPTLDKVIISPPPEKKPNILIKVGEDSSSACHLLSESSQAAQDILLQCNVVAEETVSDSPFVVIENDNPSLPTRPSTDTHLADQPDLEKLTTDVADRFRTDLQAYLERNGSILSCLSKNRDFGQGDQGLHRLTRMLVGQMAQQYLIDYTLDCWRSGRPSGSTNVASKIDAIHRTMEKSIDEMRALRAQVEQFDDFGRCSISVESTNLAL